MKVKQNTFIFLFFAVFQDFLCEKHKKNQLIVY